MDGFEFFAVREEKVKDLLSERNENSTLNQRVREFYRIKGRIQLEIEEAKRAIELRQEETARVCLERIWSYIKDFEEISKEIAQTYLDFIKWENKHLEALRADYLIDREGVKYVTRGVMATADYIASTDLSNIANRVVKEKEILRRYNLSETSRFRGRLRELLKKAGVINYYEEQGGEIVWEFQEGAENLVDIIHRRIKFAFLLGEVMRE